MHRYLVNRLTVGFRLLQHNRTVKNETETDGDFPKSKFFDYFKQIESAIVASMSMAA